MKENNLPIISPLGLKIKEEKIDINNISIKKANKFDRIIISYNFKKDSYYIADSELEGYENKEFLLNTLYNFNNQTIFKYDSPYNPTCCERILFLVPIIIIVLIIIYLLYVLTIICTLNPLIIYLDYLILRIVFILIKKLKNNLNEKFKKKAINKVINDINESEYCIIHHIKFNVGLSGYWLELEKILKEDNEMKKYIVE